MYEKCLKDKDYRMAKIWYNILTNDVKKYTELTN